jgi:hypothetical protein
MPRRPPLTECPCCKTKLDEPIDVEVLALHAGLTEDEEAVLFALIEKRGRWLNGEKIADVIYADDPNGGPDQWAKQQAAVRNVMSGLRQKLPGTRLYVEHLNQRGWVVRLAPTGFSGWRGA